MTDIEQKALAKKLSLGVQAAFRDASGAQDLVEWKTSAETPVCAACGSGPPF